MATIKCPHCRSTLTLDKVGVHFQKFCSGLQAAGVERESSVKKFNRLYVHMQSHARGEITASELQAEADRIFPGR